jgi:hypothetical protein
MQKQKVLQFIDAAVAFEDGDAFLERLTDALPEARVIRQVNDDHTSRVITFELLTEER